MVFISNFLGNGGAARVITVLANFFSNSNYKVYIYSFPFDGEQYPHSDSIEYMTFDLPRGNK